MTTMNKFVNSIYWQSDKASFAKVKKQAEDLRKEYQAIGKMYGKNGAAIQAQTKLQTKYTKTAKNATKAEKARIATQKVTDKLTHLNAKQTEKLHRKLHDLNGQFKSGKMSQTAYNHELQRTSRYYNDLQKGAKQAASAQAKLAKQTSKDALARRQAAKDRLKGGMQSGTRALAGSMVAGFAGVTAISARQAQEARERNEAYSMAGGKEAGIDFTNFQNLSAAGDKFNVDQQKVGDILKTVNERLGEFSRSDGGGEGADLFKLIQKNESITKQQLLAMSPDKILSLIPKVFKEQRINQAEQTSYMEDMASDSSLFLKSLEELKGITKQRERYGLNVSLQDNQAMLQVQQNMKVFGDGLNALGSNFVTGLFGETPKEMDAFMLSLKELQPTVKSLGEDLRGAVGFLADHGEAIKNLTYILVASAAAIKAAGLAKAVGDLVGGGKGAKAAKGAGTVIRNTAKGATTRAATAAARTAPSMLNAAKGASNLLRVNPAMAAVSLLSSAKAYEASALRTSRNFAPQQPIANQSVSAMNAAMTPQKVDVDVNLKVESTDSMIRVMEDTAERAITTQYDAAFQNINAQ